MVTSIRWCVVEFKCVRIEFRSRSLPSFGIKVFVACVREEDVLDEALDALLADFEEDELLTDADILEVL